MSNGIDDKKGKVGGVQGAGGTKNIEKASEVSEVTKVEKAQSVSGTTRSGAIGRRKLTRTMTASERDALFSMIDEEAEKLFGTSGMSEETKEVARQAVKMAVDAATVDED
jgi:hypothetical protein